MGICCQISRNNYIDSSSDEDGKIRIWEEQSLKMNSNTFKSSRAKLQNISKQLAENDFLSKLSEVFSKELADIVRDNLYFKMENNFDKHKISTLIFLLSRDSIIESNEKISEKAVYLYQEALAEPENDMSSAVEKNNPNLNHFFNTCLEITFDVLIPSFLNYEKTDKSAFSKYNNPDKKKLLDNILSNLLFKQKNEVFNFEDLNKLFLNQKWIFTTGYFRECLDQQIH